MEKHLLNLNAIGQRVKELRTEQQMTQQTLSEAISICTDNHISKLETGNTNLSMNLLISLSKYFNVSTDYILFGMLEKDRTANDVIINSILSALDEADKIFLITYLKGLQSYKAHKTDNCCTQKE